MAMTWASVRLSMNARSYHRAPAAMAHTTPGPDWRARVPRVPQVTRLLVCPPEHFEVLDVKNAFMAAHVGGVDRALAARQWDALQAALRREGVRVETLPAAAGREDLVFTANVAAVVPRAEGGAGEGLA